MTYRAGVIGCGRIGAQFEDCHAKAYGDHLVAVGDIDANKSQDAADRFGVRAYADWHRMYQTEDLQIVSVCTPPDTHCEIVTQLAEVEGLKAILCEKPIALTVWEAERMIEACASQNVLLVINHQRRFNPYYQRIAQRVRAEVQHVTCYYHRGVFNTGTHLFDLLRFCFGEVEEVQGGFNSAQPPYRFEDPNLDGWLHFRSGLKVAVIVNPIFEIVLWGGERSDRQIIDDTDTSIVHSVEHILRCLRTGEQPISRGEDGLAAIKVAIALWESAQQGGKKCLIL